MSQPDYATTEVMICTHPGCERRYTEKQFDDHDDRQNAPCGHNWGYVFDFKPDCMTEEEHKKYMANQLLGIFGIGLE